MTFISQKKDFLLTSPNYFLTGLKILFIHSQIKHLCVFVGADYLKE
jgi:hypothetical protein